MDASPSRLLIAALLWSLCIGYAAGRLTGARAARASAPMQVVDDLRPLQPTVVLEGIRDGHLHGTVRGDVRLFLSDREAIPGSSGSLLAPAGILLTHERTLVVPSGMRFVASRRGTRAYPVSASQARNIVPGNRVYFPDAESARKAGYRMEN